jgi:hypothetical protein
MACVPVLFLVAAEFGCTTSSRPSTGSSASARPTPSASSPVTSPVPLPTPGVWRTLPAATLPTGYYQGGWTGTELLVYAPDQGSGRGSLDAA